MALYRDSVGGTYDHIPSGKKKGAKGANPGPKHGGNPNRGGPQKKHGVQSDGNRSPWYVHYYAHRGIKGLELGA